MIVRPPVPALRRHLVNRLVHGDDRHAQRWRLQVPCAGEPYRGARALLRLLVLPTFGLAFAISAITTYGPVVLIHLTNSSAQVGALIGGEGALALVVPLVAGTVSDRLPATSVGRRLPFIIAGAPLIVASLILLPFSPSYLAAAAILLAFFVGYYLYYPPYRALYADLLPRNFYARAQAGQAVARGAGLGGALLAGGLLISIWRPLPFLIAAGVVLAVTLALVPVVRLENNCPNTNLPYETLSVRRLFLHNRGLRAFAIANALWEFSFTGLRSFIVLYVVRGLGRSPSIASAVIAVVAVTYVIGAPIAGRLAERYGVVRVLRISSLVYGAGLICGVFASSLTPLLIGLPLVALAGSIVMTLPQTLAFLIVPAGSEGAAAGIQDFSRGIGVVLGPIAVGAAVQVFRAPLLSTHGYAAMWPVVGIPVLLSLIALGAIERREGAAVIGVA